MQNPQVSSRSGDGGTRPVLRAEAIGELRAVARRFTDGAAAQKSKLLRTFIDSTIEDPRLLLAYHDCLLYLLAYPQTADLLAMAGRQLLRVAYDANRLGQRRKRHRLAIEDTGVAWSETSLDLSYAMASWLAERYPDHAEVAFFAEDGQPLQTILKLCMPVLEDSVLNQELSSDELLHELTKGSPTSKLQWLVGQLAALPCSEAIREHLFQSLRAYVLIRPGDSALSRTFARGLPHEPFYHQGELLRQVDPGVVINEALPPALSLSTRDRWQLIDTARGVLTLLGRETDPIGLCRPEGVECIHLGRGLSIALYWMPPGRRFPIDTHVGFVLFKNTLPVAYGGGWPFLGLCRIGIHVFEPYRGGESAYAFCQVLRVYHQRFATQRFLAEPSQFGGAEEGLTSGAFWFYHRLGFRPVDQRVAKVADAEAMRMEADPGYRTPVRVLRRLAGSDLELELPGGDPRMARCDPGELSRAVTDWIGTHFGGDRGAAQRAAFEVVSTALGATGMERWPDPERRSFESMCLLLALVPGLDRWPALDRRRAIAIMRAKGKATEHAYFDLMRTHRRLSEAMVQLTDPHRNSKIASA